MPTPSPYASVAPERWPSTTASLLAEYPLDGDEIVDVVLDEWSSLFESLFGRLGLRIGEHIFPQPQIMGNFLHEFIPYAFQARYPRVWRRDRTGREKDLVCLTDDRWSTEIKTSSHPTQVFGNRSYAQPAESTRSKSGFYITVNFERWADVDGRLPDIRLIRFGWLDHTDWIAQVASSGQQARISPDAYAGKLLVLYRRA